MLHTLTLATIQLNGWLIGGAALGASFLFLLSVGVMMKRFYHRASADEALVRTGSGGTRVVIGGGMMVLPVLHQVMRVSLRTITLTVERFGEAALVTADKIKACCEMELYIKVDDTEEGVVAAARSFGSRNVDERVLAEIVEGKLTDALRGVAANKTFMELHAQREEFAEAVKKALVDELRKNGLKLESTSLTQLRQLPISEMDPNDVFDAEGLRNIAGTVAKAQEECNRIDRHKEVEIQMQDVAARKRALELEQEQAFLEADQAKRVAEYRATKKAEEKMAVLTQEQAAAEAALEQQRAVEAARIAQEEAVATRDLQRQEQIARAQAAKDEAERTAQILAAKAIEAAQIEKQKAVEAAEIEKQKAIEAAEIAKQKVIEVATVEKVQALALAETEKARAEAAKALAEAEEAAAVEAITTAEQTARAKREKEIAVIKAQEEAEMARIAADKEAYEKEKAAQAEREVKRAQGDAEEAEARGKANAIREVAQARADEERLGAQAVKDATTLRAEALAAKTTIEADARALAAAKDAEAKKLLAEAIEREGAARAEARRLMQEAENAIDSRLLLLRATERAIDKAPEVVREFVKSAEAIGEMKVLQIGGGFAPGAGGEGEGFLGELGKTPLGLGLTTLAQGTALLPLIKGLMDHAGVGREEVLSKVTAAVKAGAAEFA
ncbi:MAG: hypothetical protein D6731_22295, partial [Planctomycetota bacterium]